MAARVSTWFEKRNNKSLLQATCKERASTRFDYNVLQVLHSSTLLLIDKIRHITKETLNIKNSISATRKRHKIFQQVRFESQKMTSFAGLIRFERFLQKIDIRAKLAECFRHLKDDGMYGV
ncbi:MAG: hypothetical protein GF398_11525 [Chitinivibrionales bacterium]|nr:hypothetical protein [Chitinivibrionales bacterium]